MIRALEIRNFKSIKHLVIDCRRINIFIGRPNTGKSNILETIGLLSHIYYGDLRKFVRLENMANLFYDEDINEDIIVKPVMKDHASSLRVSYRNGEFIGIYGENETNTIPAETVFRYDYLARGSKTIHNDFRVFKFYRFKARNHFPLKEPDFLYPPDGPNLLTVLMINKKLRRLIRSVLEEYGLRLVLKPVDGRIEVEKEYEDIVISHPYSLVSDTLQRIIFYLVAIETNKDSVIAFEEPEAHSFPYYTKFLAERIALDKRNQYFISTHNPYFLLSVIEKSPLQDIAVYITYYRDHQTKVKKLGEEEIEKILGMEQDVFFNIDALIEGD